MKATMTDKEFIHAQPARWELIVHGLFDHVEDTELFNLFCDYFNEYCEHTTYGSAENITNHFALLYNVEHSITTLFDFDNDLWRCYENAVQLERDRIRVIRASQKYVNKRLLADLMM